MTKLMVTSTTAELVRRASEWVATEVSNAIARRGSCAVALSGGRTPEPIYRELAAAATIDWTQVDVFFADERAVPPDHPESNYGMVHRALLSRVPIPTGQVHRMEAERPDRAVAARDYARSLPPELDLLLLGMGADGHTASLFPGSSALDEQRRRVLPVVGPKPPAARLTLTPPVIEAARTLAVIVTGEDKAAMVERAIEGPVTPKAIPVQLALRGWWFLDQSAAGRLRARKAAT
jgi:6-phosphogluconolactonase